MEMREHYVEEERTANPPPTLLTRFTGTGCPVLVKVQYYQVRRTGAEDRSK